MRRTTSIAFLALLFSMFAAPMSAEPVTSERINRLPVADQPAWHTYVARSKTKAKLDQQALDAELAADGMKAALRAPDGADFKLQAKSGDAYYASEEAARLTDVVLSYQTPSGGWSKHTDYSAGPRQPGMQWTSQNAPGHHPHYLATFDNRSTTEQLHFLANVWHATRREHCATAFNRGLDFIFAAQFPNGGWPQVYPLEGGYHDHVTFNDDAMTHVLELLQAVVNNEPRFVFLDDSRREQAAVALDHGIHCVLAAQVEQGGRPAAWCAQHDPLTLAPARARAFEPAALSGMESARVIRFLMSIPDPSPEVVASLESGLAWFDRAKVTGLRKTKRNGRPAYVPDPASTEVYWARFYDLSTSAPIFPGADGIIYDSFDEMAAAGNGLGYDYYTPLPKSIVTTGQKKWRKKMANR